MKRCKWSEMSKGPEMIAYHDHEWGLPVYDDRKLFEMLCLEGAQAGLSWNTVLKKRPGYLELFHNFDIQKCANMTDKYLEKCLTDSQIIRNRLKVYSIRKNAHAALDVINEYSSLNSYLWSFVGERPIVNSFRSLDEIPANTAQSDVMSKELKKSGFTFVGSTICYAFMQAVGMVNDHEVGCYRWAEVQGLSSRS